MRITVNKGPRYLLALPKLESSIPPGSNLTGKLEGVKGNTASSETIIKIRKSVSKHYRKRGYADLELEMAREIKGSTLQLFFKVSPGTRFNVRSFDIKGLAKTLPKHVRSRFKNIAGSTFDENQISKAIKKLITTGAVSYTHLTLPTIYSV